ncbi:SRPBCC family protein [Janibacter hoylei]|uniref:SRPBCC family protein n=1 Tax=Janibacter hoylei TaxID=364298 RepID=UPI0024924855|nr:SRPBCC family protein [Janibacter hoylei]
MDETKVVTASTTITAPHEAVFEEIADPARQLAWDGNDNLASSASGQRARAVGDVFVTTTTRGNDRYNHVVDFEEGRRIAWRPAAQGQAPFGHEWRWQLAPTDEGRTLVTHTYDWRELTDASRYERARSTTESNLRASLERLAALFG